jgi:predicted transcriptional regulator of viral defense system
MVTKKDSIIKYLRKHKIRSSAEILARCNVSRVYLSKLAKQEVILSCGLGQYTLMEYFNEYIDYAVIQKTRPNVVFSKVTALTLYGLSDYMGAITYVTVPNTENVVSGEKVITERLKPSLYKKGIVQKTFGGFKLKLYSVERSLCEVKKKASEEEFLRALKRYAKLKEKRSFDKIYQFDRLFGTDVGNYLRGEAFEEQQDL